MAERHADRPRGVHHKALDRIGASDVADDCRVRRPAQGSVRAKRGRTHLPLADRHDACEVHTR
ncbi:hypothetical protein ACFPRL_30535 [Pseudoclavibacter helvolus]